MQEYTFIKASPSDAQEILGLYRSLVGTDGCTWSKDTQIRRPLRLIYSRTRCIVCAEQRGLPLLPRLAPLES